MKKYIIWTPSLKLDSGGVTVLHLLAHLVNKLGFKAYLYPGDNNFETFLTNAKYDVLLASKEMIDDDSIIVYPEIVVGNPLNAKNVVRWILNKPGVLGGDGIFGDDDLLFYYSDTFSEGKKNVNILQIIELYGDMFIDKKLERKGSCYVMRKGKSRKIEHDLAESIEILDSTPSEKLVQIFNERKIFYCYDQVTFLSFQAALCGCISIVMPSENMTAKEWIELNEVRKYGVAYGEENIEHAIMTMDKVRSHLESLRFNFNSSVEKFIEKTQNWATQKEKIKNELTSSSLPNNSNKTLSIEENVLLVEELIEKNKLEKAKIILNNLLEVNPNNMKILNNYSIIAIIEKKYQVAKKFVDKVLLIDDTNNLARDNYEYLNEVFLQTRSLED